MQELEGNLSISRVTGNRNSYVEIRLGDNKSGDLVTIIKVSIKDFGAIITGLSCQDVKYQVFDNFGRFGKNVETKTVSIQISPSKFWHRDDKEAVKILGAVLPEYEIDGWKAQIKLSLGRQSTYFSGEDGVYMNVIFKRWI